MGFARFMSSLAGRLIRIVAGIALIIIGLAGGAWDGWNYPGNRWVGTFGGRPV